MSPVLCTVCSRDTSHPSAVYCGPRIAAMSSASERAIVPPSSGGRGGPCTIPGDAKASLEILSNGFWLVVDTALGAQECGTTGGTWPEADGVISAPTILRCIKPSPWIESVEVIQTDGQVTGRDLQRDYRRTASTATSPRPMIAPST